MTAINPDKTIASIATELAAMLARWSNRHTGNAWLKSADQMVSVYVRKGVRIIRTDESPMSTDIQSTLEIGNILQDDMGVGCGVVSGVLWEFEAAAVANGFAAIYVENVHNPKLLAMLWRRGYVAEFPPQGSISMFKVVAK
jgi:hypothetical protein